MPVVLFGFISGTQVIRFGSGQEGWISNKLPEISVFDFDSFSDAAYTTQLATALRQSERPVLWLSCSEPTAPLGTAAPVLEAWVRHEGPKLLLLQGEHMLIERLGKKQPAYFLQSDSEHDLRLAALTFLA